jgi:hypothetical protein
MLRREVVNLRVKPHVAYTTCDLHLGVIPPKVAGEGGGVRTRNQRIKSPWNGAHGSSADVHGSSRLAFPRPKWGPIPEYLT